MNSESVSLKSLPEDACVRGLRVHLLDEHWVIYGIIYVYVSLCCTLETNITLYATTLELKKKK